MDAAGAVVLPFLELAGEQVGVVDDLAFQEAVELLGVDPVGSLRLAVQPWGAGLDGDVADALVQQVPVERRAELLAVISLDTLHGEGQPGQDVADDLHRDALVAAGAGAQDPLPGAVIDGGELVVPLALAGLAQRLDERHIDLELVAGPLLLIPFPAPLVALVALGGWQPVHAQPPQDPPDARGAHLHVVVALQVHRDLGRPEVVVPAQPDDLLDHLSIGGLR